MRKLHVTIQKISSRFFWKNINEDIRILQHCDKCQRTNAKFSKSNAKLHPIVPMPNVWHQVVTSCVGIIYLYVQCNYKSVITPGSHICLGVDWGKSYMPRRE